MSKEKEILTRAAAIVRERWQQHENGRRGGPRCLLGAHAEATDEVFGITDTTDESIIAYENSIRAVRERLHTSITGFNDAVGRTAEEVAVVLEHAARDFE